MFKGLVRAQTLRANTTLFELRIATGHQDPRFPNTIAQFLVSSSITNLTVSR